MFSFVNMRHPSTVFVNEAVFNTNSPIVVDRGETGLADVGGLSIPLSQL